MPRRNNIGQIARYTRRQLFGVAGIGDDIKAKWDAAIADFQSKRATLEDRKNQLYDVAYNASMDETFNDDDMAVWQDAVTKVERAISAMDAIASGVTMAADAWQSVKSTVGMNGIHIPKNQGMGLLPALPVSLLTIAGVITLAVIAINAADSALTYFGLKKSNFAEYVAAGMDAETAAQQAREDARVAADVSFTGQVTHIAMWVAAGLAAVFVLPKLIGGK